MWTISRSLQGNRNYGSDADIIDLVFDLLSGLRRYTR
jgi:hypothetical protein